MKYPVETADGQNIVVVAGRIGGFQYLGEDGKLLLVSVNASQRSDEADWIQIGFRSHAKERMEQFANVGDHLTVVCQERTIQRGRRTLKNYNAMRYYIGRRQVGPSQPPVEPESPDEIPAGVAEPSVP